jgi:hypothetical protein
VLESFKNNHPICQSLKDDDTMVDESIEWIEKFSKSGWRQNNMLHLMNLNFLMVLIFKKSKYKNG